MRDPRDAFLVKLSNHLFKDVPQVPYSDYRDMPNVMELCIDTYEQIAPNSKFPNPFHILPGHAGYPLETAEYYEVMSDILRDRWQQWETVYRFLSDPTAPPERFSPKNPIHELPVNRDLAIILQTHELAQEFTNCVDEGAAWREKLMQLCIDSMDASQSFHPIEISWCLEEDPLFSIPDTSSYPNSLTQRWLAWQEKSAIILEENPKYEMKQLIPIIGEDGTFKSWPAGAEHVLRDWVDSGNYSPMPRRFGGWYKCEEEAFRRLCRLRELTRGWIYLIGNQGCCFMSDEEHMMS